MTPELVNGAVAAAVGAGLVQLAFELAVKPLRERKLVEEAADRAAAKAIAAHESSCVARNFVGPVAGDANGG